MKLIASKCTLRDLDTVDAGAAVVMCAAALFLVTFFWQVAAGAQGSEESFRVQLEEEAARRMEKEEDGIRFLLVQEEAGEKKKALEEGISAAARFEGNSQFHLFLARGYQHIDKPGLSIREYRRAVEANRNLVDRRSGLYIGKLLRPLIREARAAFLNGGGGPGGPEAAAVVGDLYFLERSLAGGCF